jgi:CRISPR-associated endonuclease Cas3-HD
VICNVESYLAKPHEKYDSHVEKVVNACREFLRYYPSLPKTIENLSDIDSSDFICYCSVLSIFHDIGKLIDFFQDAMSVEAQRPGSFDFSRAPYYRHEIISAHFLDRFFRTNFLAEKEPAFSAQIFAVLSHHKILDTSLTTFKREFLAEARGQDLPYNRDFFERACKEAVLLLNGCSPTPYIFDFSLSEMPLHSLMNESRIMDEILPQESLKKRWYFVAAKGVLQVADWIGSSGASIPYRVTLSKGKRAVTDKSILKVSERTRSRFRDSIVWAKEMLRADKDKGKLLYLLPPGSLTGWTASRLRRIFGDESVGESSVMSGLTIEERSLDTIRGTEILDRNYFRPVTVATVDQIIMSALNVGHWALKDLHALLSVVVIDEIPLTDPLSFGFWLSSLKRLSEAGTRFLIQSSSVSEELGEFIRKEIPSITLSIFERDGSSLSLEGSRLSSLVKSNLASGKRVLFVAESVKSCQDTARLLRRYRPVCLHERYVSSEQCHLVEAIEEARFVISTNSISSNYGTSFDLVIGENSLTMGSLKYLSRQKTMIIDSDEKSLIYEDYMAGFERAEQIFRDVLTTRRGVFDVDLSKDDTLQDVVSLDGFCQVQVTPKRFEQRALRAGIGSSDFEVKIPFSYAQRRGTWKRFRGRYIFVCNMRYLDFFGADLGPERTYE